MRKRLIFNCFTMNVPSHIYHGTWRHPKNELANFNDFATWANLVKKLEQGKIRRHLLCRYPGHRSRL